jgi:hypothetical protein
MIRSLSPIAIARALELAGRAIAGSMFADVRDPDAVAEVLASSEELVARLKDTRHEGRALAIRRALLADAASILALERNMADATALLEMLEVELLSAAAAKGFAPEPGAPHEQRDTRTTELANFLVESSRGMDAADETHRGAAPETIADDDVLLLTFRPTDNSSGLINP